VILSLGQTSVAQTIPHIAPSAKPYKLGIFPYLPARQLEGLFSPIAALFGEELDREVQFKSSLSYEIFMENLRTREYDVAFVQPFDYVTIARPAGYVPLASPDKPLSAIIIVRSDSPIASLDDLRGKVLALPPKVAAVSHMIKSHLNKNGLVPGRDVSVLHRKSFSSCMHHVLIDEADACGTALPALRFFTEKMKTKMKIIDSTATIPSAVFVVHKDIPDAHREKLLSVIVGFSETRTGQTLLEKGKLQRFRPISDQEYDIVREFEKYNIQSRSH
jgi:phosphonate transport system substrate-binding protein